MNEGRDETLTLVEWLAIDTRTLVHAVIPAAGLDEATDELTAAAESLATQGVTVRLRGMGAALFEATRDHPRRSEIYETVAGHTSDMVRAWAAFMLAANKCLSLGDRLDASRRFAADRGTAVRECAWDSFRPYVVAELDRGLSLLQSWVHDPDLNVRRCAVESTRPRGVWTAHIEILKHEPQSGLDLLEAVRSDPSRYVQRSVANWLNDASKSQPNWVQIVCARWMEESPTKRLPGPSTTRSASSESRDLVRTPCTRRAR